MADPVRTFHDIAMPRMLEAELRRLAAIRVQRSTEAYNADQMTSCAHYDGQAEAYTHAADLVRDYFAKESKQ